MFDKFQVQQHATYNRARDWFIDRPHCLINLEQFIIEHLFDQMSADIDTVIRDYNEASYLHPFWKNYPPDERGRAPRGDQFPWIEVGEHAVGSKLEKYLENGFETRDAGIPTGADQRFVVRSPKILEITEGLTDSAWVFIDIKSVGPRDDADHTVMSHNQISGEGRWDRPEDGLRNSIMTAVGARTSHPFHCSVPPLYVLSDGTIAPSIMTVVKPVYAMLSQTGDSAGQPLSRVSFISIPNGLLLTVKPNYLGRYPSLLYPGKDDKGKNPLKVRARVSFPILRQIAPWRVRDLAVALPET